MSTEQIDDIMCPPEKAAPPQPPNMALRTYLALRLSAVGVIAVLAASLFKEYSQAGGCLQGSISAYYFTNVQSVFVGALVTLGLVMIALWGKTPWEDGALNLAGLLAPVVAFVPTAPSNLCSLENAAGAPMKSEVAKDSLVVASHDGIFNNMLAYLVVVGLVLVAVAVFGIRSLQNQRSTVTQHPRAFWLPLVMAGALWVLGTYGFTKHREWFYGNAHGFAAITMFVFIIVVVINIGLQKYRQTDSDIRLAIRGWAGFYWGLAAMMVVGSVLIFTSGKQFSTDGLGAHRIFIVEAWLIGMLAVFWIAQTWDRRNEGAPDTTRPDATAN